MSNTSDATFIGAGSGAVQGAGAGSQFGPGGALAGAGIGTLAGAASGYFGGKALRKKKAAQEEAENRYRAALDQYQSGTSRNDTHQLSELESAQQTQRQTGMDRFTKEPTGQDYANTLRTATEKAGADAKSAVPAAQQFGGDSAYTRAAAPELEQRYAAALAPAKHEVAMGQIKMMTQTTAAKYGLETAKLNAQIAHIANTHGVEKAALAARFAQATGQYPLDMAKANRAGGEDALYAGILQGAMNIGAGAANAVGENQRQSAEHAKDKAAYDEILGMFRRSNDTRTAGSTDLMNMNSNLG